jgi:hypothetical protein
LVALQAAVSVLSERFLEARIVINASAVCRPDNAFLIQLCVFHPSQALEAS